MHVWIESLTFRLWQQPPRRLLGREQARITLYTILHCSWHFNTRDRISIETTKNKSEMFISIEKSNPLNISSYHTKMITTLFHKMLIFLSFQSQNNQIGHYCEHNFSNAHTQCVTHKHIDKSYKTLYIYTYISVYSHSCDVRACDFQRTSVVSIASLAQIYMTAVWFTLFDWCTREYKLAL